MKPRALVLSLLVLAAVIAVAAAVLLQRRPPKPAPAPPPAPAAPAAPAPQAAAPTAAEAFAALYPEPVRTVTWRGQTIPGVRFSPAELAPLGGERFALVSRGQVPDQAHAASGFYSIAYLQRGPSGLEPVGEPLLGQGSDGGYGAPPAIAIDTQLSARPTVVATSSYLATGEAVRTIELVRLGERPQRVAEGVPMLYDNTDAGFGCRIEGRLRSGGKDQLFAVVYRGAWTHAVTWTWDGTRWRSAEPGLDLAGKCPAGKDATP
jgi:hypothetical protein